MKANNLKASKELALVVLGDEAPIVTKEGYPIYEYVNKERTDKQIGYATELVLTNQDFEKIRCETPNMPKIFMGGEITKSMYVELINPVAEITYGNDIKIKADNIILADEVEL